jgi:glycogen debranching enzyme
VAAQALLALFEADHDRVFLGELYARVRRHHEWLAAHRDFDGDGLLTIISSYESGMDFKPSFDLVLGHVPRTTPAVPRHRSGLFWRLAAVEAGNFACGYDLQCIRRHARFLVKEVGLNTLYACDLQAMERLASLVGDDPAPFAQRRARVARALVERLYDPGQEAFFDVQEPGGRKLCVLTPTIFFPLAVDLVPQPLAQAVVARHLGPGGPFDVPWPMPSVAVRDPAFLRGWTPFLWRGPAWAFINWFLARAFAARGMEEHAQRLRRSLHGLLERSGFREYYDPITGEGHGARNFTWPGLLVVP